MKLFHLLPLLSSFFLFSCSFPYLADLKSDDMKILVVEGQITNEEGPFKIHLSYSFKLEDNQLTGDYVTGADVQITDNEGNYYPLYYTVNGWYETEDTLLIASVGKTYTLRVIMDDGTLYESSPVSMREVPEIDSVYYEEFRRTILSNGVAETDTWLDIFIDSHDPTGLTKYWKWEYEEIWEVRTQKDNVPVLFMPMESPSYTVVMSVEFLEGNSWRGWDNNKERCWIKMPSQSVLIESTMEKSEDRITRFAINSIPPDNDRLDIKYSIEVRQISLSKEMYEYWNKLKNTNEQGGNLYQTIPEQVLGNMICVNADKKVLGYFNASSVSTKRLLLTPPDHNIETKGAFDGCGYAFWLRNTGVPQYYWGHIVSVQDTSYSYLVGTKMVSYSDVCADCREYGDNEMPDYWE